MDPISGSNPNNIHRSYGGSDVSPQASSAQPKNSEITKVSLTDLGELADRADQSGNDIRPEVVERAKTLLDDPNWLSDDNIDKMVGKIIQNEDF
tara:strand:+ start:3745 stop:4026 length:282 start_codon:yes stop_codon:yes gene_type:complete